MSPALGYPLVKAYIHDPKEAAVLPHDMPIVSTGIVN
jgi:hypothetical protein